MEGGNLSYGLHGLDGSLSLSLRVAWTQAVCVTGQPVVITFSKKFIIDYPLQQNYYLSLGPRAYFVKTKILSPFYEK